MNKYEMIYESICDLYNDGILTEEEAEELNETAYEKYMEEKTRFEKEYEKRPKEIKKYLRDKWTNDYGLQMDLAKVAKRAEKRGFRDTHADINKMRSDAIDRNKLSNSELAYMDKYGIKRTYNSVKNDDKYMLDSYDNYINTRDRKPDTIKKINDLKKRGESDVLNEDVCDDHIEEKTRFEKEFEKRPNDIKKYVDDRIRSGKAVNLDTPEEDIAAAYLSKNLVRDPEGYRAFKKYYDSAFEPELQGGGGRVGNYERKPGFYKKIYDMKKKSSHNYNKLTDLKQKYHINED